MQNNTRTNNLQIKDSSAQQNIQLKKKYTNFNLQVKDRISVRRIGFSSIVDRYKIKKL
jgi:hypothetical protein